jgi:integrase
MTWDEFDKEAGVWRIPAAKMKMKRDHLVPLVPRALELIEMMEQHRKTGAEYVFPGAKPGMPMSENTKCKAVQSLGVNSTAHGFRSTFKDWARAAQWEDYLSEFQLAHIDDNKSREPYGRDGQLALRREMMTEWAGYIAGTIEAPNWERQADRVNLQLVGSHHVRRGRSARAAGANEIVPLPKLARRV